MGKVVPLCCFVISGSVKNLDETMGMSTVLLVLFNAANRSGLITISGGLSHRHERQLSRARKFQGPGKRFLAILNYKRYRNDLKRKLNHSSIYEKFQFAEFIVSEI